MILWSDIEVPPYTTPETDDECRARQAFDDEVIDRLFVLNAERASEERRLGLAAAAAGKKGKGRGKKKAGRVKKRHEGVVRVMGVP